MITIFLQYLKNKAKNKKTVSFNSETAFQKKYKIKTVHITNLLY
jgi:hypothetical protein